MFDPLFNHATKKLQETRCSPTVPCKICNGQASPFDIVDFNKSCARDTYVLGFSSIPVVYRKCNRCSLIFTDFGDTFTAEEWATYVYNQDYIVVDPEYLNARPVHNAREISALLPGTKRVVLGLDYGGGNGKTSALLRAEGWQFDSYDPYGAMELSPERLGRYNFCSAIEVFEHLTDPVATLGKVLSMTGTDKLLILIGTSTHDEHVSDRSRLAWWYAAPRNGHISLYSLHSLHLLAERFGLTYCSGAGGVTHLLARGFTQDTLRSILQRGRQRRRMRSALDRLKGKRPSV